jgi:hypothetical protein
MLKDAQRRRFDVIMAWAIDRLGRSLIDLLGTIQTQQLGRPRIDAALEKRRWRRAASICTSTSSQSTTTTPAGKLIGLRRLRPACTRIQAQLRGGKGILKVARELGVGSGTVQRIRQEMKGPFVGAAA